MAAIAFDPLEYAHQLEAFGVSREQAEVHAKAMTSMFLHNFEGLPRFIGYAMVTKDYLDTRFSEFETRIEAKMDRRFAGIDVRFERVDGKFRLLFWMQAITIACVVMPVLRDFFS